MGLFSFLSKKKKDSAVDPDIPVKPRRRGSKAQADEPMDPMLPEKKRARRRLVGASALVLAAVIGLPMIFDSEPKPLADDIAIRIPPRDKAAEVAINPPMPLPPPAELDDASPAAPVVAALSTAGTPVAKPPVASAAPPPKPTEDKPAAKATVKSADKPLAQSGDKDNQRFVVQVAAVGSRAKAVELEGRLKKAGIKAYHQQVSTKDGERFRVRIGPFGSRDEAEKMRSRLGKIGLSGAVLAL